MSKIGGGRLLRVCDLCGGVDDGPRHVIVGAAPGTEIFGPPSEDVINRVLELAPPADRGRLLASLMDRSAVEYHMDCCREAGCPDGTCDRVTAGAEDLRDGDLLAHLVSKQEG